MKATQHNSTNDVFDNRLSVSNHHRKVPKSNPLTGSVIGKYPVILDGGRTIIYVTDKSREEEIRSRYASRK
jgi:hypothetical protein